MHIAFIIPLRARITANNWRIVENCLFDTIASLINQVDSRWSAVVVGHDSAAFLRSGYHDRVHFLRVDFPLPPLQAGGNYQSYQHFDRILDKRRKIGAGMRWRAAQNPEVTYWQVLDADDLLSNLFVSTLLNQPIQDCWIVNKGFLFYSASNRIRICDNLHQRCGSTSVVSYKAFAIPSDESDDGLKNIPWCDVGHSRMHSLFADRIAETGKSIWFPKRSIAYRVATGENASDDHRRSRLDRTKFFVAQYIKANRADKEFKETYGIG